MKYLERHLRGLGYERPLAYFDLRWRRDKAPLLDHLAAVIDHVQAFSTGGAHDISNFVTACNKCNVRKNAEAADRFAKRSPLRLVHGKYGEPKHWDGLSTLFVALVRQDCSGVARSELEWCAALEAVDGRPAEGTPRVAERGSDGSVSGGPR
jgi:hypothetical protein